MFQKELLLKKTKENNGTITTKEVLKYGIHKDVLKELIEKKELIKIANGLYKLKNEEIDEYIYFAHRVPKGIFSHETAAFFNGLSNKMPLVYVMTVMVGDNVSRVKAIRNDVIFKYSRKDYYDLGKICITTPFGREIFIYDMERTVLDFIRDKDRINAEIYSNVIKLYFKSNSKNLLKLFEYANYMNMEELLQPYMEVLL